MSISLLKIKKLPDSPGVYFFLGKNRKVLYIGKATSLRDRVRSYMSKDLIQSRGQLLVNMMLTARTIDFRATDSVLEALILEADLIRKFKPEFNTKEKDDKSFLCLVITDEMFPVVKLIRKKDIDFSALVSNGEKLKAVFGPYPDATALKEAMKIVRKIFPYRDAKCPGVEAKRPCFNYTIGLCPGPCAGAISAKEYMRTIRHLCLFFQGKKKKLLATLEKEMKQLAKSHQFEKAKEVRDQIYALTHIQDVSLIKRENFESSLRIESYDIAHLAGGDMVGAMAVSEDGLLKKPDYRKFIIRDFDRSNDTGALGEMLRRRIAHTEWPMPQLVLVDGGEPQRKVAEFYFPNIPCLSVVKDDRHKAREILGDRELAEKYKNLLVALNADTHRYAIAFHRKRRNKGFLPS